MEVWRKVDGRSPTNRCLNVCMFRCLNVRLLFGCFAFDELILLLRPTLLYVGQLRFRHARTSFVKDSNSLQAADDGAYSKIVWPATAASANAIRWLISIFRTGIPKETRASRNCFPSDVLPIFRETSNRAFRSGLASWAFRMSAAISSPDQMSNGLG